jgi:hypothetical protein
MSEVHPTAPGAVPRPPWEFELLGVRCPACGLGGDIPSTIERTVCPRCGTVFAVLAALAERPEHPVPPPDGDHRPSAATAPSAPAPSTAARPAPPPPARAAAPERPAAPPAPAPAPPIDRRPPDAASPSDATVAAGGAPWWLVAAVGIALFAAGLLVGWLMTRNQTVAGSAAVASSEPATTPADRAVSPTGDAGSGGAAASTEARSDRASGTPHRRRAGDAHRAGTRPPHVTPPPRGARPGRGQRRAATTTAPRTETSTSDGAPDDGGSDASTTSIAPAGAARPIPASRSCSGLDCHMTLDSGIESIPLPDDAQEVMGGGGSIGWTTHVASVEDLTAWYRGFLEGAGWSLRPEASILDPDRGEERDLGHATTALYCPDPGSRLPIVAVNVGWPDADTSGSTIVLAITGGIDASACA